jgi:hypothetical protein
MRSKLAVSAVVAALVLCGASVSRADKGSGKGKKTTDAEVVPDSVNRQFQWEEKVVGPKDKGVDHKKIAAMQEQARREDAAKKKEPPKKQGRAEGISAPASSTLPTMDIEKPAAASARKAPARKAAPEPRSHDAIDDLLADQGVKPGTATSSSNSKNALGSVLAVDDQPQHKPAAPAPKKTASRAKPRHH